jgi:hypothetical protein
MADKMNPKHNPNKVDKTVGGVDKVTTNKGKVQNPNQQDPTNKGKE